VLYRKNAFKKDSPAACLPMSLGDAVV
jgi:hypothetical protein